MIQRVNYHSRRAVEVMLAGDAIVSITTPGERPPELRAWGHVCRLCFNDSNLPQEPGAFTAKHAEQIIAFVDRLPASVLRLDIHCGGGMYRSPAVARFFAQRHGIPFKAPSYSTLIYELLCTVDGLVPMANFGTDIMLDDQFLGVQPRN